MDVSTIFFKEREKVLFPTVKGERGGGEVYFLACHNLHGPHFTGKGVEGKKGLKATFSPVASTNEQNALLSFYFMRLRSQDATLFVRRFKTNQR